MTHETGKKTVYAHDHLKCVLLMLLIASLSRHHIYVVVVLLLGLIMQIMKRVVVIQTGKLKEHGYIFQPSVKYSKTQ